MNLFGHESGQPEAPTTDTKVVDNPQADREAEAASEAAFDRMEHPETLGKVVMHGAEQAGESNVVKLTQPDPETPDPQPIDPSHQLTA